MTLVDTSVWVAHLRQGSPGLVRLLKAGLVLQHPFVVGELACGNLTNRARILRGLETLPSAALATHEEVMRLIEARRLWGAGIGWIDGHLLASALRSNCLLWTLDRRLQRAAATVGVSPHRPT